MEEKSLSKPLLIPWLRTKIDSEMYPGVVWTNPEHTAFSIPWKHALRQDSTSRDVLIFKAWAEVCGNGKAHGDTSVWMRNFRSALRAKGFKLVSDNKNDAANPHKVFRWPEKAFLGDFIDQHQSFLVQRVTSVDPILYLLYKEGVITKEGYDDVMSKPTSQDKMRELISKYLNSSESKVIFYKCLEEHEPLLLFYLRYPQPSTPLTVQHQGASPSVSVRFPDLKTMPWYNPLSTEEKSLSKPLLIPWLRTKIDSGMYPGVVWTNPEHTEFSIPWKHALRQDSTSSDVLIFKAWAEVCGNGKAHGDTSVWKRNFRSALRAKGFKLVSDCKNYAANPHKVYRWPEEAPPEMTTNVIRQNKTQLQHILMADIHFIIQLVVQAKLLVNFEYGKLKSISDPAKAAAELVDKMIFKGETTCQAFLSLLQDTELTDVFPDLKTMPWYNPLSTEGMTANVIRQNKTQLQHILMADIHFIIQLVFEEGLLVAFDFKRLKSISSPAVAAWQLVDKMLNKGETTCRAFLSLLQEPKLKDVFPDLKTMPWYNPLSTDDGGCVSLIVSARPKELMKHDLYDSDSDYGGSSTTSELADAIEEEKPMKTEMQSVKSSSEEEDDEDSERWMEMMEMLKIESEEEELMKPDLDDSDNDEVYRRSCCERCQHVQQSYGNERITPEKLSRGRYQAHLEAEGTYECVLTGLIFEASERVVVGYSVLPWSKFSKFLQNPWMIAGSIFNVETVPKDESALKSIQFPHSLCLTGLDKEKVFGVLHITGEDPVIEPVEYSGSHLKWSVSSLSPVGSIVMKTPPDQYHGAVMVYKDLSSDDEILILRIYLAPNNSPSHVEDIKKDLLSSTKRFGRVEKNPYCILVETNKYHLMSDQTGVRIDPQGLMFTLEEMLFKGFFEVQYDEPPCIKFILQLQLKASGTGDTVWSTTILKGDLVCSTEKRPSKRTLCRTQRCDAAEEEETPSKRCRLLQEPGMTAKKLIIKHKTTLQAIFAAEIKHVIQLAFEAELLEDFQYEDLKSISRPSQAASELVDKILSKGEPKCREFLSLLQEPKLTDLFPDLKTMPWCSSAAAAVSTMDEDED